MIPYFETSMLSTAYFPPVEYFYAVAHSGRVLIEQHENYQKQSWRNRCRILSAGGPEDLSIPVVKEERRSRPIRDIRIDHGEPWLQHHVRALSAAYNASAFYEYYADELIPLLEKRPAFLFDLNMSLLEKLLSLVGLTASISLTDHYLVSGSDVRVFDGRTRIQPKYRGRSLLSEYGCEKPYYQVFVNKDPSSAVMSGPESRLPSLSLPQRTPPAPDGVRFIPNLSIIDLLSAEGPSAISFLS